MSERAPFERVWAGRSRVKSIIALTHPAAVILFSLATLLLALFTTAGETNLELIALLTLAMAAAQASNGVFNEVFDRELDQLSKPWRAIPAGYIQPQAAAIMAMGLLCLGLIFALAVSPEIMLLLLAGTGTGILYSLKLKRTCLSWLPYVMAYPSLTVWVLVAFGEFDSRVLWIYLIAAPFAIGIHLINQMRDFDEDQAAGIRGFAQHLGKNRAVWTAFILLALGPIPFLIMVGFSGQLVSIFLIASASFLHWALIFPIHWFPAEAAPPEAFRSLFRRLQISCLVLLLAWYLVFLHT